jgi:antitoxin (DNA-binding transcriptional repressor) of toxin-antitoxin stability system
VGQTRQEIIVTKHGRPVARLVPLPEKAQSIVGCMKGAVTRYGDLVSPVDERWTADA